MVHNLCFHYDLHRVQNQAALIFIEVQSDLMSNGYDCVLIQMLKVN